MDSNIDGYIGRNRDRNIVRNIDEIEIKYR